MEISLEVIIFWLILLDSLGANIIAWLGKVKWYHHNFRLISRYFPLAKGWTTYYLALVLWIGYLMLKNGMFGL